MGGAQQRLLNKHVLEGRFNGITELSESAMKNYTEMSRKLDGKEIPLSGQSGEGDYQIQLHPNRPAENFL